MEEQRRQDTDRNVLFLFSTDGGPRNNLKRLMEPAAARSWHVVFPSAEECTLETAEPMLRSHASAQRKLAVVTGLSSFKNDVELKIGECVKTLASEGNAVEWWIIADTHYSGLRPPARGKIAHVRGVFPATEAEIPEYLEFGYELTRIYYVGGPPEWQAFWRVRPVDLVLTPVYWPLFYFGGVKDPALTDAFLEVGFAGADLAYEGACHIIVGLHPAEDGKPKDIPIREWTRQRVTKLFEEWRVKYNICVRGNVIFDIIPKITSAELTVTADYPFSTGGGTDGIVAAMHRKSAFFWETEEVRRRNLVQLGREEWYPAEKGALVKVVTAADVAREIMLLQEPTRRSELIAAQKKLYPKPSERELARPVAENILDCIANPGDWA